MICELLLAKVHNHISDYLGVGLIGLLLLVLLALKYILSYYNELSHSVAGQSTYVMVGYVIMPSFAKLIAITFSFYKNNSQDCFNNFLIGLSYSVFYYLSI